ncbi:Glucan endo-1,3-alpha-glucosidase agn1 [Rhodotorula sphaerocarpa]
MLLRSLAFAVATALVASRSVTAAAKTKQVFAHVMFGEVQGYEVQDYVDDQVLAREVGTDAFAVNVAWYDFEPTQLERIFAAAEQTKFPLFFSFDMLHWNKAGASDAMLNERLAVYANKSTYHRIDGKIVVSTFNGAEAGTYLDGVGSFEEANQHWNKLFSDVKAKLELETYFAPCWLSRDPITSSAAADLQMNAVMNWFAWGGAGQTRTVTAQADANWHDSARQRGVDYWAPVGAVFNVRQASTNNYCYPSSDQFLIAKHYGDLIKLGDNKAPDYIEFITFNDWGESTYLGPVRSNRNAPQQTIDTDKYVSGHNHTAFLVLSAAYTQYKSGTAPVITSEVIFWWSRQEPIGNVPALDPLGRDDSCKGLTDEIFIVALLPEDSAAKKVVVTTGGKTAALSDSLQPGVNFLQTPFGLGETAVSLQDGSGKELVGGKGIPILSENPSGIFDPNFFAFMEPRDFMPP